MENEIETLKATALKAEREAAQAKAELAQAKAEAEQAKAEAATSKEEAKTRLTLLQGLIDAFSCAGITVQSTVTMDSKWQRVFEDVLRLQYELKDEGGPANEEILKEYPGPPEQGNGNVTFTFQNIYAAMLGMQKFIGAGVEASKYWKQKAASNVSASSSRIIWGY